MAFFVSRSQDIVQVFCTKQSSKQDVASGVDFDISYLPQGKLAEFGMEIRKMVSRKLVLVVEL